jgi:hypothetical protein
VIARAPAANASGTVARAVGVGVATALVLVLAATGCGGTLDAGRNESHGPLPVDERNPVILENDGWSDNWFGEYAILLANTGGPPLAGIIASSSEYWPDANYNANGWRNLVEAARSSGLDNIPAVTTNMVAPLVRPASGVIDETTANNSMGAQLIVRVSRELYRPGRPVVALACAPLTTVADAYLLDKSVVDRVVVVALQGSYTAPSGAMAGYGNMNGPNGNLDPWAGWIVAQRFRYVQISAYYDQRGDVADADVPNLPDNALGDWMAAKRADLFTVPTASDQVAALSLGLPTFATEVQRVTPDVSGGFDGMQGPPLRPSADGNAWIVTKIAAPLAQSQLWKMLVTAFGM